ncbi:MAG: hypothetical protein JWO07_824 [Candidatus Saccharibacteria bacterium]|nr:hypothetical protein [Candidatus Saccharibacteria bacterium]
MAGIAGPGFQIGPDCGVFFDAQGTRIDDNTWTYNVEGGNRHLAIEPSPISPTIRDCIKTDHENGHGNRIAQIHLHKKAAVFLTLERKLQATGINYVFVRPNCFIRIPVFWFEGSLYELYVMKNMEHDVLTADVDGVPI